MINRKKLQFLSTLLLILLSLPSFVCAQSLLDSFESVKQGRSSVSELLDRITSSNNSAISSEVSKYKHLAPGLSEASAGVLLNRLKQAVSSRDFNKAKQIKSLAEILLPKSWPESIRIAKLSKHLVLIENVKENILELNSIYKDKLTAEDKKIIEAAAKNKVLEIVSNAKSKFKAIDYASKASVIFPDLDVGVKDLFTSIQEQGDLSSWNFDKPDIKNFVFDFLEKSDENKQIISDIYITKTLNALKNNNQNRSEIYYRLISPYLDAEKRTAFKRKILDVSLDGDLSSFVKSIAIEFSDRLSFTDKFKLLTKGFYGWYIFLIPVFLLLLPLLFLLKPKKKSSIKVNLELEEDEYTKLLKKLGLNENASESQIKKAFRALVKEHHPDAHGAGGVVLDQDGNVDQKFEELRKTYDRLLEIRSRWFN